MKTRIKYLVAIVLLAGLWGCASIQPQLIKFDDKNAELTLKAAKQIMKHEDMNSKFLRGIIGSSMDKLPKAFSDTLDKLDKLQLKYGADQSQMTEGDAGTIVAYAFNLIEPSAQAIINQYWPGVWQQILKWIPIWLVPS